MLDPDGWRASSSLGAKLWAVPISRDEWEARVRESTCGPRDRPGGHFDKGGGTAEPKKTTHTGVELSMRARLSGRPNSDKLPAEDFEALLALAEAVEVAGPCEFGCGLLGDEYVSPGVGIAPACPVHGPLAPDVPSEPRSSVTVEALGDGTYRTRSGEVLTDEDIQALADEAERGYDVSHLLPSMPGEVWIGRPGPDSRFILIPSVDVEQAREAGWQVGCYRSDDGLREEARAGVEEALRDAAERGEVDAPARPIEVAPKKDASLEVFPLQEFVDGGFLYLANRALHMFGLALMVDAREVCKTCGRAQDDAEANHRPKHSLGGAVREDGFYPHPFEGELRAVDGSMRVVSTSDPSGLMFDDATEERGRHRLAAWIRENWNP